MKKITSLCLLCAVFLTACENTIDITADYEQLSVIYALFDPAADTNYVRVQRGYLSDQNPQSSVGNPDSLYYDSAEIDVLLREFSPSGDKVVSETPLLFDNTVPLDSGLFTGEGHHLYRIPSQVNLQSDREYEVVVVQPDGKEATGRSGVAGNIDIRRPPVPISNRFFNGQIEFNINQGSAPMVAYQVNILFHYRELNLRTKDSLYATETIELPLRESNQSRLALFYDNETFTNSLKNRIEAKEDVIRFFEGMTIEVYGAAEELVTYFQLNEPSSSINQNRPTFQQITNGTGLVSSRTLARRTDIKLDPNRFFPALQTSAATCNLRFASVRANGDTCFCSTGMLRCR